MAQQNINLGTTANDGTGDKLNIAFAKVQNNFDDLYDNKEDSINIGGASQFLNGMKEWQDLNVNAVVGLQTALDARVSKGGITASGLTTNSGIILGRRTTGTGAIENLDSVEAKTLLGLENVSNTSDANKPISTAVATALAAKQDSLPNGTNSQFLRGDKTFVAITKSDVGLNAVDNTADNAKPVFQATSNGIVPAPGATAFSAGDKFLASNGTWVSASAAAGGVTSVNTRTGAITLTKSDVGLANVDNTSDANKPVSGPQQNALDDKADLTHTHSIQDVNGLQSALNAKESTLAPAATDPATKYLRGDKTWQTLDKGSVGLANVDNTSDLDKPVSTAVQTLLNTSYARGNEIVKAVRFFYRNPAEMISTNIKVDIVASGNIALGDMSRSRASVLTAEDEQVVFTIRKNTLDIGTITFAAGELLGVISVPVAGNRNFSLGDIVEIVPPVDAPALMANLSVVLRS